MKQFNILVAGALISTAFGALAHGESGHQSARQTDREQMPWGVAGEARGATRTLEIGMGDDMRFVPDTISVRQGETIRFVVRNKGAMLHEIVFGTRKTLDEHAAMMAKFPAMEHDEPYMAHVKPGKSGEIVWTFNRAGDFQFACLIAGHYQAGMVGTIKVVPAADIASASARDK